MGPELLKLVSTDQFAQACRACACTGVQTPFPPARAAQHWRHNPQGNNLRCQWRAWAAPEPPGPARATGCKPSQGQRTRHTGRTEGIEFKKQTETTKGSFKNLQGFRKWDVTPFQTGTMERQEQSQRNSKSKMWEPSRRDAYAAVGLASVLSARYFLRKRSLRPFQVSDLGSMDRFGRLGGGGVHMGPWTKLSGS